MIGSRHREEGDDFRFAIRESVQKSRPLYPYAVLNQVAGIPCSRVESRFALGDPPNITLKVRLASRSCDAYRTSALVKFRHQVRLVLFRLVFGPSRSRLVLVLCLI